jgi:hypothetical protein
MMEVADANERMAERAKDHPIKSPLQPEHAP